MKKLLFLFVFICALYGCEDEVDTENQLTPITQTGAGTFSCKVNGEVWKVSDETLIFGAPRKFAILRLQTDSITIYAQRASSKNKNLPIDSEILVRISNAKGIGEYFLNEGPSFVTYGFKDSSSQNTSTYSTSNEIYGGSLRITKLDTAARIISGTFDFKIKKSDGAIVNFTDGRFDLKFGLYP